MGTPVENGHHEDGDHGDWGLNDRTRHGRDGRYREAGIPPEVLSDDKRKAIEAAGFKVGDYWDFLGLSQDEVNQVEMIASGIYDVRPDGTVMVCGLPIVGWDGAMEASRHMLPPLPLDNGPNHGPRDAELF